MLKIGLTGGIASGKSVVASRLEKLGAVLVDADALAREVVEPGTEGLQKIVAEFGGGVLSADGRLDRPKLGALVFGDTARLAALNGIVHPLVRSLAAAIVAESAEGAVVVQDIPLLVETGQGGDFHLVVVVDAPDEVRVRRMVEHRGMTAEAARSRMAAQATREERLAAADVVLENSGTLEQLVAKVDRLWEDRLAPFARNLSTGETAARTGKPLLVPARTAWAGEARRLMGRIAKAVPAGSQDAVALNHIGSTAVPGLDAVDVIDLQLTVPDDELAGALAPVLAACGFPAVSGTAADNHKPNCCPNPEGQRTRLHANADPGRPVNLHVRAAGSPCWRCALCFRDWLRAEPAIAAEYLALKRRLEVAYAGDMPATAYAAAKEEWLRTMEKPLERWVEQSGWQPPPSMS